MIAGAIIAVGVWATFTALIVGTLAYDLWRDHQARRRIKAHLTVERGLRELRDFYMTADPLAVSWREQLDEIRSLPTARGFQ